MSSEVEQPVEQTDAPVNTAVDTPEVKSADMPEVKVDEPPKLVRAPRHPKDLDVTEDQVNVMVDTIKNILQGRKVTQGTIIRVVANCMSMASGMRVSNGTKKKIVINGIERYIREQSDLNQDEIDTLMAFIDVSVSESIDTISAVAKGEIDLAKGCCVII